MRRGESVNRRAQILTSQFAMSKKMLHQNVKCESLVPPPVGTRAYAKASSAGKVWDEKQKTSSSKTMPSLEHP
jgi:hypothetical protein